MAYYLGIELGSTRIKAILLDESLQVVASGQHSWENQLVDGIWTYSLEMIEHGLQDCYHDLKQNFKAATGQTLKQIAGLGISAMMHGYLALDAQDHLMRPFKTWRNTDAREASAQLTEILNYNIPERWSIAHLYKDMLAHESYIHDLAFFTTLSGYIHYRLSGRKVLGIGDAVGMFTMDCESKDYGAEHLKLFDAQAQALGYSNFELKSKLPQVLCAGQDAGELTNAGAAFLDPEGDLLPGVKMCPPEGDAGTGMVATNAVLKRTGNVSAGTSIFAMIVLEKQLNQLYREIDNVTTPDGSPVAMVHANNCTSELNAQVKLFLEFTQRLGLNVDPQQIYKTLFNSALEGALDCGGVNVVPYWSGEFITGLDEGRPLTVRHPNIQYTLSNLMRAQISAAFCALRLGMDTLTVKEKVKIDCIVGHGGIFKTEGVAQSIMAQALNTRIDVYQSASEGGAYGIALLAAYRLISQGLSLPDFLQQKIFYQSQVRSEYPTAEGVAGFERFLQQHQQALKVEQHAVQLI